jgi:hypothetical protein
MSAMIDKARQEMEETSQERETRSAGGFRQTEKNLPTDLGSRRNIPLVDNVTSYFGGFNRLAKKIDSTEEIVWLLDNTAYRPVHVYPHKPQPWQAEFVVAFFKKHVSKDLTSAVADIAGKLGLGPEDKGLMTIENRLQPFVRTIAPARFVEVKFRSGEIQKLGPGGRSAVSQELLLNLGEHNDGDTISISAAPPEASPHGPMITNFAEPEGWLVISGTLHVILSPPPTPFREEHRPSSYTLPLDIDDSIKITGSLVPMAILRSTFVDEPTPIAGMPELYAHVKSVLNPTWYYLSASPYNLYPFLHSFLHVHYPPGPIILRDASWQDLGGFLASLTQGTEAYKTSRMDKIHGWLPRRKVLCVGDSTQSDPEAYGNIARKYKGWVKAVFIRKVTDVAEMKGSDKNKDERFEKAFKDVPREIWKVFEDPKELYEAVDALKGT